MLKVFDTLEIRVTGKIKNNKASKISNQNIGDSIKFPLIRTTLDFEKFKEKFFAPDSDGEYLERCCGKGNVKLKLSIPSFYAIEVIVGPIREKEDIYRKYNTYLNDEKWDHENYKRTTLLSLNEIEKLALYPFKLVYVRNFGEVGQLNLEFLKKQYYKAVETKILNSKPSSYWREVIVH